MANHKYIDKKWVKGKWQYLYEVSRAKANKAADAFTKAKYAAQDKVNHKKGEKARKELASQGTKLSLKKTDFTVAPSGDPKYPFKATTNKGKIRYIDENANAYTGRKFSAHEQDVLEKRRREDTNYRKRVRNIEYKYNNGERHDSLYSQTVINGEKARDKRIREANNQIDPRREELKKKTHAPKPVISETNKPDGVKALEAEARRRKKINALRKDRERIYKNSSDGYTSYVTDFISGRNYKVTNGEAARKRRLNKK